MACHDRSRMTADVRAGYLLPYGNYGERIGIHRFVQDIPKRPGHPTYDLVQRIDGELARLIDCPMCIFWGERDFCFTTEFLSQWVRRFPRAEVHTFAGAGHYVLEDAYESILPRIRAFVGRIYRTAQGNSNP
jgi:haloalkane dehalogenase